MLEDDEEQEIGGWFSMTEWEQEDLKEEEEDWENELARTGLVFWRTELENKTEEGLRVGGPDDMDERG